MAPLRKLILALGLAAAAVLATREPADEPGGANLRVLAATTATTAPPAPISAPVDLPAHAREVLKLVQGGLDETVVRNYIALSDAEYRLTPDQILHLRQAGVSNGVLAAMLQRGAALRERREVSRDERLKAELELELARVRNRAAEPRANPAANVPPPANLPEAAQVFYEPLQPHGEWFEHASHGHVWQPRIARVNTGWQPYADRGRWLATDQGWYWQSDYEWGWAAFHHGRWARDLDRGWVWLPDRVWGPSWVTWRMSGEHLGWAPLPPGSTFVPGAGLHFHGQLAGVGFHFGVPHTHYTFVPLRHAFSHTPLRHALDAPAVARAFRHTAVINHIVSGDQNVVIHNGVPIQRVAAFNPEPLRLMSVRTADRDDRVTWDRVSRLGAEQVLFRPAALTVPRSKPAVLSDGATNHLVKVPWNAPDDFQIAGRPKFDYSTGEPVLTGYSTTPERTRGPRVTIINNVNVGGESTTSTSTIAPETRETTPPSGRPAPVAAPGPMPVFHNQTIVNQQIVQNRFVTIQPTPRPQPVTIPLRVPYGAPLPYQYQRPLTPPQPVTSTPKPVTAPATTPHPHANLATQTFQPIRPVMINSRLQQELPNVTPPGPPAPVNGQPGVPYWLNQPR